jgi:competence protein ComEA
MLTKMLWMGLLLSAMVHPLSSSAQESGGKRKELPEGKGKNMVAAVCSSCHGLSVITDSKRNLQDWKDIVDQMVAHGAPLQDDEVDIVTQYLAKNFALEDSPPDSKAEPVKTKINMNKSSAKELESGLELTEKEASAIVSYREKHGDFKNEDDLKKVDGIDVKKIEAAKDRLTF